MLEVKRHKDWLRGDRAWDFVGFLRTGEVFEFVGQTVAGLASFAACLFVYTGLALAWRWIAEEHLNRPWPNSSAIPLLV